MKTNQMDVLGKKSTKQVKVGRRRGKVAIHAATVSRRSSVGPKIGARHPRLLEQATPAGRSVVASGSITRRRFVKQTATGTVLAFGAGFLTRNNLFAAEGAFDSGPSPYSPYYGYLTNNYGNYNNTLYLYGKGYYNTTSGKYGYEGGGYYQYGNSKYGFYYGNDYSGQKPKYGVYYQYSFP